MAKLWTFHSQRRLASGEVGRSPTLATSRRKFFLQPPQLKKFVMYLTMATATVLLAPGFQAESCTTVESHQ